MLIKKLRRNITEKCYSLFMIRYFENANMQLVSLVNVIAWNKLK